MNRRDIDIGTARCQCRCRRSSVSMRDRLAAVACYVLVFLVLPAMLFIAAAARGWRP